MTELDTLLNLILYSDLTSFLLNSRCSDVGKFYCGSLKFMNVYIFKKIIAEILSPGPNAGSYITF